MVFGTIGDPAMITRCSPDSTHAGEDRTNIRRKQLPLPNAMLANLRSSDLQACRLKPVWNIARLAATLPGNPGRDNILLNGKLNKLQKNGIHHSI